MSFEKDVFKRIEGFYSKFGRYSSEAVLVTFFNMSQGKSAEEVSKTIAVLIDMSLIQSINAEISPTVYGIESVKNGAIDDIFTKQGL